MFAKSLPVRSLDLSEKDQELWEKTLDEMSREEFFDVMRWGTDVINCKKTMDRYLRKYNPFEAIY